MSAGSVSLFNPDHAAENRVVTLKDISICEVLNGVNPCRFEMQASPSRKVIVYSDIFENFDRICIRDSESLEINVRS